MDRYYKKTVFPISYRKIWPFWCVSQWLVGPQTVCTSSLNAEILAKKWSDENHQWFADVHGLSAWFFTCTNTVSQIKAGSRGEQQATSLIQQLSITVELWANRDMPSAHLMSIFKKWVMFCLILFRTLPHPLENKSTRVWRPSSCFGLPLPGSQTVTTVWERALTSVPNGRRKFWS